MPKWPVKVAVGKNMVLTYETVQLTFEFQTLIHLTVHLQLYGPLTFGFEYIFRLIPSIWKWFSVSLAS